MPKLGTPPGSSAVPLALLSRVAPPIRGPSLTATGGGATAAVRAAVGSSRRPEAGAVVRLAPLCQAQGLGGALVVWGGAEEEGEEAEGQAELALVSLAPAAAELVGCCGSVWVLRWSGGARYVRPCSSRVGRLLSECLGIEMEWGSKARAPLQPPSW